VPLVHPVVVLIIKKRKSVFLKVSSIFELQQKTRKGQSVVLTLREHRELFTD